MGTGLTAVRRMTGRTIGIVAGVGVGAPGAVAPKAAEGGAVEAAAEVAPIKGVAEGQSHGHRSRSRAGRTERSVPDGP